MRMKSELPSVVGERWIIMGDITKSTSFLNELNTKFGTQRDIFLEIIERYISGIEDMFLRVQRVVRATALLGNTMGDGFLLIGMHGHENFHIKYEFPNVLLTCQTLQKEINNEVLNKSKNEIEKIIFDKTGTKINLPSLKIKICVNWGLIATSIAFNRFSGVCINHASRILSRWDEIVGDSEDVILLTQEYFDLLPDNIKVLRANFEKQIERTDDYPKDKIYKIPINKPNDPKNSSYTSEFWGWVEKYMNKWKPTEAMEKLADELYNKK